MNGLFHIYTGDGKGKTTAALGLVLRAYGRDMRTLYGQFFKSGKSGELKAMGNLKDRIVLAQAPPVQGFVPDMTKAEQEKTLQEQGRFFRKMVDETMKGHYDLVVMDEGIYLYTMDVVPKEEMMTFIQGRPPQVELVLTGRGAPPELIALADYVSEIKNIKHPFEQGIPMRKGIEF